MPADMFLEAADDPRREPPATANERETLVAFLQWYRDTLDVKCSGLDAEQLARRALEPSSLSLLGLVRHMAEVERGWFRRGLAGEEAPPFFYSRDNPDGDFDDVKADAALVSEAWEKWREEMDFADRFIAAAPDLDVLGKRGNRGQMTLRWVLVHMIEEYARHCGHADLLRERIDGRVGQ